MKATQAWYNVPTAVSVALAAIVVGSTFYVPPDIVGTGGPMCGGPGRVWRLRADGCRPPAELPRRVNAWSHDGRLDDHPGRFE